MWLSTLTFTVFTLVRQIVCGSAVVPVPDVVAYPYTVDLLYCLTPFFQTSPFNYVCNHICQTVLTDEYLVSAGATCVDTVSASGTIAVASGELKSFRLSSSNTLVDDSIRYKISNAGSVFVTTCIPTSGSTCDYQNGSYNFFGRVYLESMTQLAGKSHKCNPCSAKTPIVTVTCAGQLGGLTLHNGLSWEGATVSTSPDLSLFSRPSGTIVNYVSFDRDMFELPDWSSESTIQQYYGFNSSMELSTFWSTMDSVCQQVTATGSDLVTSFSTSQYLGRAQCADAVTGESSTVSCVNDVYLPFTGPNNNQEFSFNQAGTVAICTCGQVTPTFQCGVASEWVFAGLLTVAGPVGGQQWSIPYGVVFDLSITGYGLGLRNSGRDFLRIIPSTSSCFDSGGNPTGVTFLEMGGCPSCSTIVGPTTDIPLLTVRSADDGSLPKIVDIKVYATHTLLIFANSVKNVLQSGDMIAISPNNFLVEGRARNLWTPLDMDRVYQLTGKSPFMDDRVDGCPVGVSDCDNYLNGHVVTVLDLVTVSIPPGLTEFATFIVAIASPGADWEKHSSATTNSQLTAFGNSASRGNIVCWGRLLNVGDPTVQYFAQAGTIDFIVPKLMTGGDIGVASKVAEFVQPVTVQFMPNFVLNENYIAYAAFAEIELKITLMDLSLVDIYRADMPEESLPPIALPVGKENEKSAQVCGYIFKDMALNDDLGFPIPSSCKYSPVIVRNGGVTSRELSMYFAPSVSGVQNLRSICSLNSVAVVCFYRVEMIGSVSGLVTLNSTLVQVDTICPNCDETIPFNVIERLTVLASWVPFTAAVGVDLSARVFPDSTDVTAPALFDPTTDLDTILDLPASTNSFKLGIVRNGGLPNAIQGGDTLRLFMAPGLHWNFTETTICTVSDVDPPVTLPAGQSVACAFSKQGTALYQFNIVNITLPVDFPPIISSHTVGGPVTYPRLFTIQIADTAVGNPISVIPPEGFWPTRFIAMAYGRSIYTVSRTNNFIAMNSSVFSIARIVKSGMTGDGPHPFANDIANTVEIELMPERTIHGAGAFFTLTLPQGYVCGGFATSGLPLSGVWSNEYMTAAGPVASPNACTYTFSESQLMTGQSWVLFNLTVSNPSEPLLRTDTTNVWQVQVGLSFSDTRNLPPAQFSASYVSIDLMGVGGTPPAQIPGYMPSLAVLNPLLYANVQPESFFVPSSQLVQVFLVSAEILRPGYQIVVVPPKHLAVTVPCAEIFFLPTQYSYPSTVGNQMVSFVPGDIYCGTSPYASGLNSAVFVLTRLIDGGNLFGFQIGVNINNSVQDVVDWNVFTTDGDGNPIGGTSFAAEYDGIRDAVPSGPSFSLAAQLASGTNGNSIEILFASAKPLVQTLVPTVMTVANIGPGVTLSNQGFLRLTMPSWFQFVADNEGSWGFQATKTCTVGGVSEWSIPRPKIEGSQNIPPRLVFDEWGSADPALDPTCSYAFSHLITVPSDFPRWTSYAGFFEVFENIENTNVLVAGSVVALPPIAAVVGSSVDCDSTIAGTLNNTLIVSFQVTTQHSRWVKIRGDSRTAMFKYDRYAAPTSDSVLPEDVVCELSAPGAGPMEILLSRTDETAPEFIPSVPYILRLQVDNPEIVDLTPSQWTISTDLDFEEQLTGFALHYPMGNVTSITDVSDQRPLRPSVVKLSSNLNVTRDTVSFPATLNITIPPQFMVSQDCQGSVAIEGLTVTFCRATPYDDRNVPGSIVLTADLLGPTVDPPPTLSITVNVARNPPVQPLLLFDTWKLWVNDKYASGPIPSFSLFQFDELLVQPVSTFVMAATPNYDSYPVNFTFIPRHSLPVTNTGMPTVRTDDLGTKFGELNITLNSGFKITAPSGFVFSETNLEWNDFRTIGSTPTETGMYSLVDELFFNKTNGLITVAFIGNRSMEAGETYSFVTDVQMPVSTSVVSGDWFIQSFIPENESPVDELTVSATSMLPLNARMADFAVTNTQNNFDNNGLVSMVSVDTKFGNNFVPATVYALSNVTLTAPPGFTLRNDTNGALGTDCWDPMTLGSTNWTAICPFDNTMVITTSYTTLPNVVKTSQISVRNPNSMGNDIRDMYWKVSHSVSDSVIEQAIYPSWRVYNVLDVSPTLNISGANLGSGSTSNITLAFTPQLEASFLHINITFPVGFNFSNAVSNEYEIYHKLTESCNSCIGLNNVPMLANVPFELEILNVDLGKVGGITNFDFHTFYVPPSLTAANPFNNVTTYRDMAIGVNGSFLAGIADFIDSSIFSIIDIPVYAAEFDLNPRLGYDSVVSFTFNITLTSLTLPNVVTGNEYLEVQLVIEAPHDFYKFRPDWDNYFSVTPTIGTLQSVPQIVNDSTLIAVFDSNATYFLDASQNRTITLPIVPLAYSKSFTYWKLDLHANSSLLATNDGLSLLPASTWSIPVGPIIASSTSDSNVALALLMDSIPNPNTQVTARFNLTGTLPEDTNAIILVSPPSYDFIGPVKDCNVTDVFCGQVVPETFITNTSSTTLTNRFWITPSGNFINFNGQSSAFIDFQIVTPINETLAAGDWVAIGYNNATLYNPNNQGSVIQAWGALPGFTVDPLTNVELLYGGISGIFNEYFYLNIAIEKNNTVSSIEISPPSGISLICDKTLIIAAINCTLSSSVLNGLQLNVTNSKQPYVLTGSYAIPFRVSLPLSTPSSNLFDIILRGPTYEVTNAIYGFPGRSIIDSGIVSATNPTISMSSVVANSKSIVTLAFTMAQSTTSVDAVTITFPYSYYHQIATQTEVTCVNRNFPKSPNQWVDLTSTQSLTFLVDNTQTAILGQSTGRTITLNKIPGNQTFVFTFPVFVPATTASVDNFWVLSFCPDRNQLAQCIDKDSTVGYVQLPIPGPTVIAASAAATTTAGLSSQTTREGLNSRGLYDNTTGNDGATLSRAGETRVVLETSWAILFVVVLATYPFYI